MGIREENIMIELIKYIKKVDDLESRLELLEMTNAGSSAMNTRITNI